MEEDCIFCTIVNGKAPCAKISESEHAFAFLSIMPVNKGHILVIPKKHYKTLDEIPDDEVQDLMLLIKKNSIALKKVLDCPGFSIVQRNGKEAGQEVHHVHFHIIPRFTSDGHYAWAGKKLYKDNEMEEVAKEISSKIN